MITYPNLYHLKYFCDSVSLGSISGAAQKNLVTHPAISRAISALEKHLGTSLLEHRKKSFKVTETGHQVAKQAKILLSAASDFETLSLKLDSTEAVMLKIGISRSLSDIYLNPLILELKKKFPFSNFQVRFGTTNEIIEAVASNSIDLGLTIGMQQMATLKQREIQKGKFLLVESNIKNADKVNVDSKLYLLTEPRYETEKFKSGYKKQFGKTLSTICEISSWEIIGKQVQKGLGVGLLPDIIIRNWKQRSFRILKTTWFDCPYSIYLHKLKSRPNTQIMQQAQNIIISL